MKNRPGFFLAGNYENSLSLHQTPPPQSNENQVIGGSALPRYISVVFRRSPTARPSWNSSLDILPPTPRHSPRFRSYLQRPSILLYVADLAFLSWFVTGSDLIPLRPLLSWTGPVEDGTGMNLVGEGKGPPGARKYPILLLWEGSEEGGDLVLAVADLNYLCHDSRCCPPPQL